MYTDSLELCASQASEATVLSASIEVLRAEVARACRVAQHLRLLDPAGHVSARLPDGVVVATPRFTDRTAPPQRITAADTVVCDSEGTLLTGDATAPPELAVDLAVYRERGEIGAMLYGSPESAMSFGIAGADILPLAHTQSEVIHDGITTVTIDELPLSEAAASPIARALRSAWACHVPGLALAVAGRNLVDLLRRSEAIDYLARLTAATLAITDRPRLITRAEVAAAAAQRPQESVPSRPADRYYSSLDPGESAPSDAPPGTPSSTGPGLGGLKERIALACRILAAEKTLVAYYEHVSHRTPSDDRFLMSPAKTYWQMEAKDIGLVGTAGDCEWLSGPYPPAPFRWYHRDLLAARPDVNAIVHTHELYGRALPLAGIDAGAVFRNGSLLAWEGTPVFPTPTMAFIEEHRRELIRLLGTGSSVHLLSHGTDYLAATLEEATVAAIHREQQSRLFAASAALGPPAFLAERVIRQYAETAPSATTWWAYYAESVLYARAHNPGGSAGREGRPDGV